MEEVMSFVKPEVPAPLIPNSYATPFAAAWGLIYQEYCNAMPLYCQGADWKQLGVSLSCVTMVNWIIYCATNYFAPL